MNPSLSVPALLAALSIAASAQMAADRTGSLEPGDLPASGTAPAARILAMGELTGDASLDLLAVDANGTARLYRNEGGAAFSDGSLASGLETAVDVVAAGLADHDGSGSTDALLLTASGELRLFANDGSGYFVDVTAAAGLSEVARARHVDWMDVDGDEQPDLLVGFATRTVLYTNTGASFEAAPLPAHFAAAAAPLGTANEDAATTAEDTQEAPGRRAPRDLEASRARVDRAPESTGSAGARTLVETPKPHLLDPTGGSKQSLGTLGCTQGIADQSGGCLQASSLPTLGMLYPLSNDLFVALNGDLGAGTIEPLANLHVVGDATLGSVMVAPDVAGSEQHSELFLAEDDDGTFGMSLHYDGALNELQVFGKSGATTFGPHLTVDRNSGATGIGTQEPAGNLHVMGDADLAKLVVSTNYDFLFGGQAELWLGGDEGAEAAMVQRYAAGTGKYTLSSQIGGLQYGPHLSVDQVAERVGIGTETPLADLHVSGGGTLGRLMLTPGESVGSEEDTEIFLTEDDDGTFGMRLRYDGVANEVQFIGVSNGTELGPHLVVERAGRVGIGTSTPATTLDVAGGCRVQALDIVAGADVVEGFETSDGPAEPGTVLVIDPTSPGELRTSREAYDPRVAGVVSGAGGVNPGLRLGQPGVDGDTPLAMAGRVWVKATAATHPIVPGDRLTTSDVPGHAMAVADATRADGSVIGKAMTSLESGRGLVLVLVNLQ